jgi:hypothetical protein
VTHIARAWRVCCRKRLNQLVQQDWAATVLQHAWRLYATRFEHELHGHRMRCNNAASRMQAWGRRLSNRAHAAASIQRAMCAYALPR